jgi:N utilization substance protein B
VRKGSKKIDQLIVRRSEKWDFARIAIVDKLILRIAIAELLFFDDIPPKVTINEAIEIAKRYSTDNSSRFVNGVLDGIYSDIKDQIKCD